MKVEQTPLEGCFIVHDTVIEDERGFFFESFNKQRFLNATGIDIDFIQDNQSRSVKGVLRGLHFQQGDFAQAKLVRVLHGKVLDVAVDLRRASKTFGEYFSLVLSESSRTQLFVPRGFAHGFVVLSETADFFYKCDNYYNKESEAGIIYNDTLININWQMPPEELIISSKDRDLPLLNTYQTLF